MAPDPIEVVIAREVALHPAQTRGGPAAVAELLDPEFSDRAGRRARRSSLWRHTVGQWHLLYHQGTLATDGAV